MASTMNSYLADSSPKVTVHLSVVPQSGAVASGPSTRTIVVPLKGTYPIGRSSKNASKNLRPLANNAFFECAVMSRAHAILSVPNGPYGPVMLEDTKSMHGIYLNGTKLTPRAEIKPGDAIRFGSPIACSDTLHAGVEVRVTNIVRDPVTFSTMDSQTQSKTFAGTYQVPEDSDPDSEEEACKDLSLSHPSRPPRPDVKLERCQPDADGQSSQHPLIIDDDDVDAQSRRFSPAPYFVSEPEHDVSPNSSDNDSIDYPVQDFDRSDSDDDAEADDDDDDTPSQRSQSPASSDEAEWGDDGYDHDSELDDTPEAAAEPEFITQVDLPFKPCIIATATKDPVAADITDSTGSNKDTNSEPPRQPVANVTTLPPITSIPTYPPSLPSSHTVPLIASSRIPNNTTFSFLGNAGAFAPPARSYPHYAGRQGFSNSIDDLTGPSTWNNNDYDGWDMPTVDELFDRFGARPAQKSADNKPANDFAFSSMTLPPATMPPQVSTVESAEEEAKETTNRKDSLANKDLVTEKTTFSELEQMARGSFEQEQASVAPFADIQTETATKVGDKRKRDVDDDGTKDAAEQDAEPTTSRRKFLAKYSLRSFRPKRTEITARPIKRVKRTKKDVALGAVAGALGGVVAVLGVLMTPQCEQLLRDWPIA